MAPEKVHSPGFNRLVCASLIACTQIYVPQPSFERLSALQAGLGRTKLDLICRQHPPGIQKAVMSGVLRSMRPLARRLQGDPAVAGFGQQQRRCMAGEQQAVVVRPCNALMHLLRLMKLNSSQRSSLGACFERSC